MTNQELIEELQKHPGYYPAVLAIPAYTEPVDPGFEVIEYEIGRIQPESIGGPRGVIIKIGGGFAGPAAPEV